MSLILVYFILLNGRTTEREGGERRGEERRHIGLFVPFQSILE